MRRLWNAIKFPPAYEGAILSGRLDGFAYLLGIVIVIHRRMGHENKLTRSVVWQWWLGPWDPVGVGRLVWLPVRMPEAARALAKGSR